MTSHESEQKARSQFAVLRSQFSILNSQFLRRDRGQLLIIALFLLLLPFSLRRIYATDEVQYFAYLRSVYFDHDLDFRNEYEHFAKLGEQQQPPDPAVRNALLHNDAQNPNPITGKLRNVAPVGSAIMWAPGFVLADIGVRVANALGAHIPADGYSPPYISAVCLMSAFYSLGGLLLSYRLARRYAGSFAATVATIAIWLATPLVMYTFILMPWSHATGFFLFALFLTIWLGPEDDRRPTTDDRRPTTEAPRNRRTENREPRTENPAATSREQGTRDQGRGIGDQPSWKNRQSTIYNLQSTRRWALLGLIGGLMTMTREQLGLLLIIPAAEAMIIYVNLLRTRRWAEVRRLLIGHLLFAAVFVISLTPQLAAYQILNGRPLPSATVSGKLIWCSPHFIDTLIDYNPQPSAWCYFDDPVAAKLQPFAHGAFLWSPILMPALLGLALLARGLSEQRQPNAARGRHGGAPLLAALLLLGFLAQTYINGAFGTSWHLSRSFGFRRLIECTPIFVVGLAMLLAWLRTRAGRWPLLLALCLIGWNIGLIAQWTFVRPQIRDGLIWDGMLRYQVVEVPRQAFGKIDDLIFHRCRLAQNKTC